MRLLLATAALLTGCATTSPLTTIRVPVPVECRVTVPDRPTMPTNLVAAKCAAKAGACLDDVVQAVTAEIEIREAYEDELRVALDACVKPLVDGVPK